MTGLVDKMAENIVGKGENAGNQCFPEPSHPIFKAKPRIVWYRKLTKRCSVDKYPSSQIRKVHGLLRSARDGFRHVPLDK